MKVSSPHEAQDLVTVVALHHSGPKTDGMMLAAGRSEQTSTSEHNHRGRGRHVTKGKNTSGMGIATSPSETSVVARTSPRLDNPAQFLLLSCTLVAWPAQLLLLLFTIRCVAAVPKKIDCATGGPQSGEDVQGKPALTISGAPSARSRKISRHATAAWILPPFEGSHGHP